MLPDQGVKDSSAVADSCISRWSAAAELQVSPWHRVCEIQSLSVAVIEAGIDRSDDVNVLAPSLLTALYGNPDYDWIYTTTPQESANDRVIGHPRGKQLGVGRPQVTPTARHARTLWRTALGIKCHQLPCIHTCIAAEYQRLGSAWQQRLVVGGDCAVLSKDRAFHSPFLPCD